MSEPTQTSGGRRAASGRGPGRRRLDVTTVLAVVLPLVTVLAVLLVDTGTAPAGPGRPTRTTLQSASVVCPAALAGDATTYVSSSDEDARGRVELRVDDQSSTAQVAPGRVTTARTADGPVVVTGKDDLAPGLVAARFGGGTAATSCPQPDPDQWFTGVGAGAQHGSVLELVNPDAGPAVADVTVLSAGGPLDVPRLRGVSVPGHSSVRLDLADVTPRRGDLALHVVTARGRLGASVLDSSDELGRGAQSSDWLPAQDAPSTRNVLLGLPAGAGDRTLTLANDGDDEVRADVKVVSEQSVFAPEGLDEVRVPPHGVASVTLTQALAPAARRGGLGLQVESTRPVTATLRSFVGGDLSHAVPTGRMRAGTVAIVPTGRKSVLLADADGVGAVTVVSRTADGQELARKRVELRPGRGATVPVPSRAASVAVLPKRIGVRASVLATGDGATLLPLAAAVRKALVPDVRPGLT